MSLFSDSELAALTADPIRGVAKAITKTKAQLSQDNQGWYDSDYDVLLEAFAVVTTVLDSRPELRFSQPDITGSLADDCTAIYRFLEEVGTHLKTQNIKETFVRHQDRVKAVMGAKLVYEFSQGDLDRIQVLINEIRDLVAASHALAQEHRERLLRRLERMQSELHKRTSDLDKFYGLVGEAGVVLGKLGKDAKPIVDRIREVAQIVWGTQARAEELPSGTTPPILGHDQER